LAVICGLVRRTISVAGDGWGAVKMVLGVRLVGWRAWVGDWGRWVLGDPVAFVRRGSASENLGRRT
jgi:hypothetical protein